MRSEVGSKRGRKGRGARVEFEKSAKCGVSPLSNSEDEQEKAERGGSGLDSDDVGDV
jgi:hypothetical protein|tara:strand:- start:239 stop:409 length:171 start_codon:yes stop_codon:yes gene_type:complete